MARVIEHDIKTLERRKWFDRPGARVPVANHADGAALVSELLRMAARARGVPRQSWSRRVVFATMAQQTRQPRVPRFRMREPGKILRRKQAGAQIPGFGSRIRSRCV